MMPSKLGWPLALLLLGVGCRTQPLDGTTPAAVGDAALVDFSAGADGAPGMSLNGIRCGIDAQATRCASPTPVCCVSVLKNTTECVSKRSDCHSEQPPATCADSTDCASGQVCCANDQSIHCSAASACQHPLCPSSQCDDQHCCRFGTSGNRFCDPMNCLD